MMLFETTLPTDVAREVPLRLLAHLGDAVFELFEREREVVSAPTARRLHQTVVKRVNAVSQAQILTSLMAELQENELDIVRRGRNLKVSGRKGDQAAYRQATALEALLGYLFLTDKVRLEEILALTLKSEESTASNP